MTRPVIEKNVSSSYLDCFFSSSIELYKKEACFWDIGPRKNGEQEGIKDRSDANVSMEGMERGKWSVAYPFKLKFVPFRCDLG